MHPFARATPLSTPSPTTPVKNSFSQSQRLRRGRDSLFSNPLNLADTLHHYVLAEVELNAISDHLHGHHEPAMSYESHETISDMAMRYLPSPVSTKFILDSESTTILKRIVPLRQRRFRRSQLSPKLNLVLHGQNETSTGPVYGRNASIEGVVLMDRDDGVLSVEGKVEGRINFHQTDASDRRQIVILSERLLYWRTSGHAKSGSLMLPFQCRLPSTYSEGSREGPLPPTFETKLSGFPGFTVSIQYYISICVTRKRTAYWPLERTSHFMTTFRYRLRVMAPRPTTGRLTNSSAKAHEFLIKSRSSNMKPIACTLYLPDSAVWPIQQPIPFQLRMTSDILSLSCFSSCFPQLELSVPNSFLHFEEEEELITIPKAIAMTLQFPDLPMQRASIRLFIARRVALDPRVCVSDYDGVKNGRSKDLLWKMIHCGEGKFGRKNMGEDSVSWKGEIPPDEQLTTPGFVASRLAVEDFLILSIIPPDASNSGLRVLREMIPVHYVTDSYREKRIKG